MKQIYKKELFYYLNNPIGYIVVGLFAVFANFLFVKDIFSVGSGSMKPFFGTSAWLLAVFVPAFAMRSFSEEKRSNTIETLLTLPVSETKIVLGKFFALLTVSSGALLLTIGLPISLSTLTNLSIVEVLIGYIGLVFMMAMFLSVSLFFSSQTKNQIIAFLFSSITVFIMLTFSGDFIGSFIPRAVTDALYTLSPLDNLDFFVKGLLDFRAVIYFVSFTTVFLFMTITSLQKRK